MTSIIPKITKDSLYTQKQSQRSRRGFTLVELLVVISIIGMLSSVVLASLQSARERGRVGAGIKFAGYNYRTAGDDPLLMWDFNNAGSTVYDRSGNGYDGTLTGAVISPDPSYDGSAKSPVFFSGAHYVRVLMSPVQTVSNGFTVSFWSRETAVPSSGSTYLFDSWDGTNRPLTVFRSSGSPDIMRVQSIGSCALAQTFSNPISGKWQQITVVYNGAYIVFIDGKEVSRASSGSCPLAAKIFQNVSINRAYNTIGNLTGYVDDVFVFKRPLSVSEVHDFYLASLAERNLALVE